jgi:hypothetical protein
MNITLPNLKPDSKSLYIHKVDKICNPIINFVCVYIYIYIELGFYLSRFFLSHYRPS